MESAFFHLSVKCLSRSSGSSAVAAAAYRACEALSDQRTGADHDYTRKRGLIASELVLPNGSPAWTRTQLWNAVEAAEKRKNSTVAREVLLGLPHQLDAAAHLKITRAFALHVVEKYGVAVDFAIHSPSGSGSDERNVHAHVLTSTRVLTPAGFGEKARVLDARATGPAEVLAWRAEWERIVNAELQAHGIAARVDHRSLADQGIDRVPTVHVGHGAGAEKRAAQNNDIREANAENDAAAAALAQAQIELIHAQAEADAAISAAKKATAESVARLRASIARPAKTSAEELRRDRAAAARVKVEDLDELAELMRSAQSEVPGFEPSYSAEPAKRPNPAPGFRAKHLDSGVVLHIKMPVDELAFIQKSDGIRLRPAAAHDADAVAAAILVAVETWGAICVTGSPEFCALVYQQADLLGLAHCIDHQADDQAERRRDTHGA